jgi:iron(II)-dependent oxidoreductase
MLVMDHRLWDPIRRTFTVNAYIQDARRRFGGIDSIIMSQWDSYPNLGVDERNQFDFFRSMPGGAVGLKTLVSELHAAGLRVLFSFNPGPHHSVFVEYTPIHDHVMSCHVMSRLIRGTR